MYQRKATTDNIKMEDRATSSADHHRHHRMHPHHPAPSFDLTMLKLNDASCDSETCATARETPSLQPDEPLGVMSEGVRVVIEELNLGDDDDGDHDDDDGGAIIRGAIPPPRPGSAPPPSTNPIVVGGNGRRVGGRRRNTPGNLLRSFKGGFRKSSGGADDGTSRSVCSDARSECDQWSASMGGGTDHRGPETDDASSVASFASSALDFPSSGGAPAHLTQSAIGRELNDLPRKWRPKGKAASRMKNSLMTSFTRKNKAGAYSSGGYGNDRSSHSCSHLSKLSPAEAALILADDNFTSDEEEEDNNNGPAPLRRSRKYSTESEDASGSFAFDTDLDNELDVERPSGKHDRADSWAVLESLGDSPSAHDLEGVAALRAGEYIEECLSADVAILDREAWEKMPTYHKADLEVGRHLGKGSFSDAFEVVVEVADDECGIDGGGMSRDARSRNWVEEKRDLDSMMRAKFSGRPSVIVEREDEGLDRSKGQEDLDREIDAMFGDDKDDDLDNEIEKLWGGPPRRPTKEDMDREIDAMFALSENKDYLDKSDVSGGDDLDKQIDAMFGSSPKPDDGNRRASDPDDGAYRRLSSSDTKTNNRHEPLERPARRTTVDLGQRAKLGRSICLGTEARSRRLGAKGRKRRVVVAMKCLRPQIRSDADQFMIGVEDLVHETAMLASLEHPNIIKIHGRARAHAHGASSSSRLGDGYFILIDRLEDTLDDRIRGWKRAAGRGTPPPGAHQVEAASQIAGALSYLHSRRIAFRDLKPPNVGFDGAGVLKLFDFGFAVGLDEQCPDDDDDAEEDAEGSHGHLLYDKCGTPRYMAPEVSLGTGYDTKADVYSFGILLWEICSLKKPFGAVKSADEFQRVVVEKGARPKVGRAVPDGLAEVMAMCWATDPAGRPEMGEAKSMLDQHLNVLLMQPGGRGTGRGSLRSRNVFRSFSNVTA